jgi:hypothetical protein
MNAVDFFDQLGVLHRVTWVAPDKSRVRIRGRKGLQLQVFVELPFCKTWILDRPWTVEDFLNEHAPHKPAR